MNLANLLLRTARANPDRPAVALGAGELYDYRELARRASAIGAWLLRDLSPGDRVALFMRNGPRYLELLYGIWHAGLVAVPINNKLHPNEAAWIVEDSQAGLLAVSPELAEGDWPQGLRVVDVEGQAYREMLRAEGGGIVPRAADALAWLFYTSGTTGRPKGVMLTHRNLLVMTLCYFSDVDDAAPEDSVVYAAPMSHGAGLYSLPHILAGSRHVLPESAGFDPAEILELGRRYGRLALFAAPTMVKRLVQRCAAAGEDPGGIKTVVYGGGPMYVEDIQRALDVMGGRFVQIYGQGESPMTITALARRYLCDRGHPRWLARIGSVGVAQSAVEVRVADEAGRALPAGETGEVLVRGDVVMAGYWRNPVATAQALRQGWLWTGDLGSLDEDGFLTLKDRSKDLIISGGSNIYPREVEEVLLRHPAVAEVSVVGRPSAEWGEEVVAFVCCAPGRTASPDELDRLCLAHIARYKRPKYYVFLEVLPKNNYGKVLKTVLRERLAQDKDS